MKGAISLWIVDWGNWQQTSTEHLNSPECRPPQGYLTRGRYHRSVRMGSTPHPASRKLVRFCPNTNMLWMGSWQGILDSLHSEPSCICWSISMEVDRNRPRCLSKLSPRNQKTPLKTPINQQSLVISSSIHDTGVQCWISNTVITWAELVSGSRQAMFWNSEDSLEKGDVLWLRQVIRSLFWT